MSWPAIQWVHASRLDAVSRAVMHALAYRHDEETNKCAPGRGWLVRHVGLKESALKVRLSRLKREGWFDTEERKNPNGSTGNMQFNLRIGWYPEGCGVPCFDYPPQGPGNDPQGPGNDRGRGRKATGGGVGKRQNGGAATDPQKQEPTTARGPQEKSEKGAPSPLLIYPGTLKPETWNGYALMRYQKEGDIGEAATRFLFEELAAYAADGYSTDAIVRYCVAHGWKQFRFALQHLNRVKRLDAEGDPEPAKLQAVSETPPELAECWRQCKDLLGQRIAPEDAEAWLSDLALVHYDAERVVIGRFPNTFFRSRFLTHYRGLLLTCLETAFPGVKSDPLIQLEARTI